MVSHPDEQPSENLRLDHDAVDELKRNWSLLNTALSSTPDFVYSFDLEGRFTYVNSALLKLWQKKPEQAIRKNFFDLDYPHDLAERLQNQIQQVIKARQPVRDQTAFTGPDGETRYYEYIFVPVLDESGQTSAVVGSTRDTTEQQRAVIERIKSEERLSFALEAGGGVGAWDWNTVDDLVYCNSAFARLFSVDAEQAAKGLPIAEFTKAMHSEDRPRVSAAIDEALTKGKEFSAEYRVIRADNTIRWVMARGRCHLDEEGKPAHFPGVVFDITERKLADQALLRKNGELEEFAYVASHDLQEPLRTVNIYSQILLKHCDDNNAKLKQYADFIQSGVSRMETLLRDLLLFSRAAHDEELPIGSADLAQVLADARAILKTRIEETEATINAEPLPSVQGDRSQMTDVFQNLLSNALKYRKEGIRPIITISAKTEGDCWVVSFQDNGIGFEPKYAEQIFGLFKRLHKNEYEGTGLGLAICKRIVERYGGKIWAESSYGDGATFHCALRAAENTTPLARPAAL